MVKLHKSTVLCFSPSLLSLVLLAANFFYVSRASATPYASGTTNAAGTIKFILNESADKVELIFDRGAVTNDLGSLSSGLHSFPLGAHTNYEIVVSKESLSGFLIRTGTNYVDPEDGVSSPVVFANQISSDTNVLLTFLAPRGLAINCNPRSPYFGRIYVANAGHGENVQSLASTRAAVSSGIYALNADYSDALGLGDAPSPAGLTNIFSQLKSFAPNHISIGEDDQLYICDWRGTDGNIYVSDPNLTNWAYALKKFSTNASPAPPVGVENNHGTVSAVCATGSLKAGDLKLYTLDCDLQSDRGVATKLNSLWEDDPSQLNSLWEYDIGAGPLPYEGFQTNRLWTPNATDGVNSVSGVIMDMDYKKGSFYITSCRIKSVNCSGLVVRTNTSLSAPSAFSSYIASQEMKLPPNRDILHDAVAVAVCPNQPYAAVLRQDGRAWILPLNKGIPDLRNRMWLESFPRLYTARAIKFDAAGNLYIASGGQQMFRVFSPGGKTVATTGNNATGTAGAFKVVRKELPVPTKTAAAQAPPTTVPAK